MGGWGGENEGGARRLACFLGGLFLSRPHPAALHARPTFPPPPQFRTYKIIYRRYAGLFFSFCVDLSDNELSYVEAIHCFVEMLDRYFGNVCELDLVFNFHKAYTILDEFILAGELQETSQAVMLERLVRLLSAPRSKAAPPRPPLTHLNPTPEPPRACAEGAGEEYDVAGQQCTRGGGGRGGQVFRAQQSFAFFHAFPAIAANCARGGRGVWVVA